MRSVVVGLMLGFAGVVMLAVKLAIEKEYAYWAPRVGAALIRLATQFLPKPTRATRRQEWLAELDVLQRTGQHGLLFALSLLLASPLTGLADRRNQRAASAEQAGGQSSAAATSPYRSRPTTKRRVAALALAPITLATTALLVAVDRSATPTRHLAREIQLYNKVTTGLESREDRPAYLSYVPANFCRGTGCAVEGTDVLTTGATTTAECQTAGARTTNGDDSNPADDSNPELFESRRWYGIRRIDGRFGFLSEVWVRPEQRGGLNLPVC